MKIISNSVFYIKWDWSSLIGFNFLKGDYANANSTISTASVKLSKRRAKAFNEQARRMCRGC